MKNLKTSIALLVDPRAGRRRGRVAGIALARVVQRQGRPRWPDGRDEHDDARTHSSASARRRRQSQLRITLDQLLGEHAILAIQATQRGFAGGADFSAVAKQLDANSVAISKAIALGLRPGRRQRSS